MRLAILLLLATDAVRPTVPTLPPTYRFRRDPAQHLWGEGDLLYRWEAADQPVAFIPAPWDGGVYQLVVLDPTRFRCVLVDGGAP